MFNPNTASIIEYSGEQLRSTKSYIFKTEDILGEGATSKVFLGRNKKSGEKVAVKVFNNASFDRPSAVQEREFNVLQKIKHENIVRLLAIENDEISKHRIILMELCDCSVLNMLDKPEYIYGFPEKDFLKVLEDTCSGMKYLQEQHIVHRDIKPGNIMRKLGPDRTATYKLADFGAARQLQEDENFTSLYGTEEYLHPQMFGRALLRKPLLEPFTAKVDLWSLGVTIYHIATGVLPFRPYGGRKNRRTMHKITTQKATGVISAVQRESEDGPIEYGNELPKTCRISSGLRSLITQMLVGILESEPDKMWSFETLFEMTQSILNKRSFDIFNVASAQLLRVYIDPDATYAEFQEHIAMQTNIPPDRQIFIYDNDSFHSDLSLTCASYPETSEGDPIILIPPRFGGSGTPIPFSAPSMPKIESNYSLDGDYPLARLCAGVLHFMQRKQKLLNTTTSIVNTVVKSVRSIVQKEIMQLSIHLERINSKKQLVANSLINVEKMVLVMHKLLQFYLEEANGNSREGESIRKILNDIENELTQTRQLFEQITSKQQETCEKLERCQSNNSKMKWDNKHGCRPYERCCERLDVIRKETEDIMQQYRQDKKARNLGGNEVLIHQMNKSKLSERTTLAVSLVNDHCEQNWRDSHFKLMAWFQQIYPTQEDVSTVASQLTNLMNDDYPKILEEIKVKCPIWETRIQSSSEHLLRLLKISYNLKFKADKPILPVLVEDRQAANVEHRRMSSPPRFPDNLSPFGASDAEVMTAVQRAFKRKSETHGVDVDHTKENIEHSQKLTKQVQDALMEEEVQDMSLGVPDQPY